MKLAFVGYGSFARQLEYFIHEMNMEPVSKLYFDDVAYEKNIPNAFPFQDYIADDHDSYHFILALGYKQSSAKQEIVRVLLEKKRKLFTLVHPTSIIAENSNISDGCIIFPGCIIDTNVSIQTASILHNGVIVSHDSQIGENSYLGPGVNISGNCKIGNRTFLGTGTNVANGIQVGSDCVIGIGSCVTHNIDDNSHAIGNPLKIVTQIKLQ